MLTSLVANNYIVARSSETLQVRVGIIQYYIYIV